MKTTMDNWPTLPECPACHTMGKSFVYSQHFDDLVCKVCGDGPLLPPQITVPAILNTALFLMVLGLWVFGAWLDGGLA